MHTGCKNRRGVPGALLGAEGAKGEARRRKDAHAQGGSPTRVLEGAEAVEHGSGPAHVAAGGLLTSCQGRLANAWTDGGQRKNAD